MIICKTILKRTYSIAIIGPPASGKGTISKWLSRDFDAIHISTGDLLRQNRLDQSINIGMLATDTVVLDLLKNRIKELKGKFCLDGFPRRKSQAEALERILIPGTLEAVILLDLPESVLVNRITDRWIHLSSGRTYSYSFSPPKSVGVDDITGEPLIQRSDDLLDSFKTRMHHYKEHLEQIKEFYRGRGILYSFHGNNSLEIYENILKEMRPKYSQEKQVKENEQELQELKRAYM